MKYYGNVNQTNSQSMKTCPECSAVNWTLQLTSGDSAYVGRVITLILYSD